ncbi:hypothetical protein PINS_up001121 [Pythium insidiosum]|nr:hypothetical protein PINS_up001121 [Pythium insidiosum]
MAFQTDSATSASMDIGGHRARHHLHQQSQGHLQLRASYHGGTKTADFFADTQSDTQSYNMTKSRRLTGESHVHGGDEPLPLSSSSSSVLLGRMSEPIVKAECATRPALPLSASLQPVAFSTSVLDSFRLDSSNTEHNKAKTRVAKPVPKRTLHTNALSTPKLQPALPVLPHFLSPKDPQRSAITSSGRQSVLSSAFVKPTGAGATEKAPTKRYPTWQAPPIEHRQHEVKTHRDRFDNSAKMRPTMTPAVERSEVESDQCSSDEEFCMETEISLSQDKLNNLSVHDIPDQMLNEEPEAETTKPNESLVLQLSDGFASTLSEIELKAMQDMGIYTVPLTSQPSPLIMGRDQFYSVFGEKIRGFETFHLSRRHCLFHVSRSSRDSSVQFHIVVENTSTNGLEVNGRPMKHGERRDLHVGDMVTLLKIRTQQVDSSLAYVVTRSNATEEFSKRSAHPVRSRTTGVSVNIRTDINHEELQVCGNQHAGNPSSILRFPKLSADIVIADPFTASVESPHQPQRGYREELSSIMSAFSSVKRFQPVYDCATRKSVLDRLQNRSEIFFYAGSTSRSRLLAEDESGMPAHIGCDELSAALSDGVCKQKLIIVFSRSISTAQLFVDAGALHVLFVNSSASSRTKAARYLRALVASLLKGSTIQRSHVAARRIALGVVNPSPTGECLCGILPGGGGHEIVLGSSPESSSRQLETCLPLLNASLIPNPAPHFIGREETIAQIIGCLRQERVRVCSLKGGKGVGKSSLAAYVAKYALDRRWYNGGVHYVDVESEMSVFDGENVFRVANDVIDADRVRRAGDKIFFSIEETLAIVNTSTKGSEYSVLLVLDGCDRLEIHQLRQFIMKIIHLHQQTQILITIRQEVKLGASHDALKERSVHVQELSATESATLLERVAKAHLDADRLKTALSCGADALSSHPALVRLKGNPLLITRLAAELKHSTLDELA